MNKLELLKRLEEIKGSGESTGDRQQAYNNIVDAINDYEGDEDLSYILEEFNLVSEEEAFNLFNERESDTTAGIRAFINNTYTDDMYLINGYNNLSNVKMNDILGLIDSVKNEVLRS